MNWLIKCPICNFSFDRNLFFKLMKNDSLICPSCAVGVLKRKFKLSVEEDEVQNG